MIAEFAAGESWPGGVSVQCVDTGLDTPTGGRVARLGGHVGGGRFMCTYADGVADLDVAELLRWHEGHGRLATMTVVQPELQFGVCEIDEGDGRISGFREKPRSEHWINGGFFCFEPGALPYIDADSVLERAPLEGLARDGELRGYRHRGFWECMDTYKDAVALNDLWASGDPPWRRWDP
jgi:glucose-1-phosphate cytidylyltransferase